MSTHILAHEDAINALPINDLDAGRFAKKQYRREDGVWLSYRQTSKTSGEWYEWDGKTHVLTDQETDDTIAGEVADEFATGVRAIWQAILNVGAVDRKTLQGKSADLIAHLDKADEYARNLRMERNLRNLRSRIRLELRVPRDYFDQDKRWLVMSNGWVLDTSHLDADALPPSPTRPVTRKLGVTLDDEVELPVRFLKWLEETLPDDDDRSYLQEAAGAALLGGGLAKNIVHLVGPSHTGKSTYLNIMEAVFGSKNKHGYSGTLPNSAITKTYSGANFAQAEAHGVRFLKISEPSTSRVDDSFLKNLSGGGEVITTERKGRDPEEWYSQCVFHIAANSIVRFDTKDPAIVQRMNIIEFNRVVPEEQRVEKFEDALIDSEGGGILAWILEGARRYREQGRIMVSETIRARGQDNVVLSSAPLRWLREAIDEGNYYTDPSATHSSAVTQKVAFQDYSNWAVANNEKTGTKAAWREEIERFNGCPTAALGKRIAGAHRVFGLYHRGTFEAPVGAVQTGIAHVDYGI